MRPLSDLPADALRGVAAVLTDLDDTLTSGGRIAASVLGRLEDLQAAGLKVGVVTGRSAGWGDLIARAWPVDGVVAENGGCWFHQDRGGRVQLAFAAGQASRDGQRRLEGMAQALRVAMPDIGLAADQPWRLTDLAIDIGEDRPPLPGSAIEAILAALRGQGATATASACHVNCWIGSHDKLSGARALLAAWGLGEGSALFVGDSANDAAMFAGLPLTIGVANVRRHLPRLPVAPAYVTTAECGAGFCELADRLLAARLRRS